MCGRYQFTEDAPELREITEQLRTKGLQFKTGEIFPTNIAPLLIVQGQRIEPAAFIWGFPHFKGTGVIINARSETAHEKRMFKHSLMAHRCAVPTSGFFEWDANKRKHLFRQSESGALYLAGLYREFAGESRFVILTTAAGASMGGIHDRMPVILHESELSSWILDTSNTFAFLQRAGAVLTHEEVAL